MELHEFMKMLALGNESNEEFQEDSDTPYGGQVMMVRVGEEFYELNEDLIVTSTAIILVTDDGQNEDGQYTH